MKKVTKAIIALLVVLSLLCMNMNIVNATEDSYTITLTSAAENYSAGSTVELLLKVKDINIATGEQGIGSYRGEVEYDSSIFEDLTIENVADGWDNLEIYGNSFVSVRADGEVINEDQTLAKITLKVKDGVETGNYTVKVTNFKASDGENTITTSDCQATVKVVEIIEGDVNQNGTTDITDLLLLKRHIIAGSKTEWILTGASFSAADMNKDNVVDATDLLLLKRTIVNYYEPDGKIYYYSAIDSDGVRTVLFSNKKIKYAEGYHDITNLAIHYSYYEDELFPFDGERVDFINEIKPEGKFDCLAQIDGLKEIKNIQNLNTSKMTDMHYMFGSCSELTSLDLSSFDTSNVTNMDHMFIGCSKLTSLDLSSFDTSNVQDMSKMFSGCSSLKNLDISSFDTSKVTNMFRMFDGSELLKTIKVSNNFVTTAVTDSTAMFDGCTSLVGGNGTTYDENHRDAEYARIDTAGAPGYFTAAE